MKHKLYDAFDKIRAEDALKEKITIFLSKEIEKNNQKHKNNHFRRITTVCTSFVLILLVLGFIYNLYFTPKVYIDFDVNPSIELEINYFGHVIRVNPYNSDGAVILEYISIRNKPYEKVISILLEEMIKQGFLLQDSLVSITVQSGDENNDAKLLDSLKSTVLESLTSHHTNASIDIFSVTKDIKNCSDGYDMTPAKYLAVTKLLEIDPDVSYDNCRMHSINEIMQIIEEYDSSHHEENLEKSNEDINNNKDCNDASVDIPTKPDDQDIDCNDRDKNNNKNNSEHGNKHH